MLIFLPTNYVISQKFCLHEFIQKLKTQDPSINSKDLRVIQAINNKYGIILDNDYTEKQSAFVEDEFDYHQDGIDVAIPVVLHNTGNSLDKEEVLSQVIGGITEDIYANIDTDPLFINYIKAHTNI